MAGGGGGYSNTMQTVERKSCVEVVFLQRGKIGNEEADVLLFSNIQMFTQKNGGNARRHNAGNDQNEPIQCAQPQPPGSPVPPNGGPFVFHLHLRKTA